MNCSVSHFTAREKDVLEVIGRTQSFLLFEGKLLFHSYLPITNSTDKSFEFSYLRKKNHLT